MELDRRDFVKLSAMAAATAAATGTPVRDATSDPPHTTTKNSRPMIDTVSVHGSQ